MVEDYVFRHPVLQAPHLTVGALLYREEGVRASVLASFSALRRPAWRVEHCTRVVDGVALRGAAGAHRRGLAHPPSNTSPSLAGRIASASMQRQCRERVHPGWPQYPRMKAALLPCSTASHASPRPTLRGWPTHSRRGESRENHE